MGITVYINHHAEIDEWINKHSNFRFLKENTFPLKEEYRWNTSAEYWYYKDKTTYALQVMFIGKTGYGKSTTLNKLVGKEAFETSDVTVCTKQLYTALYRINRDIPSFFMLSDLPGMGETYDADSSYYKWYKEMLDKSCVVVYVLRADQRDFSVDEQIIKNMLYKEEDKKKLIIAINYADKIEPINRSMNLSEQQIKNLERRVEEVSRFFSIDKSNVIYYSATDGINIDLLERKIAEKVQRVCAFKGTFY